VLSLCAAGRDEGSFGFEARNVAEQIAFHVQLIHAVAELGIELAPVRVAVSDFTNGQLAAVLEQEVLTPIAYRDPMANVHLDPNRSAGRGYYDGVCFKIFATDRAGAELEVADGGATSWTRKLLSDQKERLVISGLGVERLCLTIPSS